MRRRPIAKTIGLKNRPPSRRLQKLRYPRSFPADSAGPPLPIRRIESLSLFHSRCTPVSYPRGSFSMGTSIDIYTHVHTYMLHGWRNILSGQRGNRLSRVLHFSFSRPYSLSLSNVLHPICIRVYAYVSHPPRIRRSQCFP